MSFVSTMCPATSGNACARSNERGDIHEGMGEAMHALPMLFLVMEGCPAMGGPATIRFRKAVDHRLRLFCEFMV